MSNELSLVEINNKLTAAITPLNDDYFFGVAFPRNSSKNYEIMTKFAELAEYYSYQCDGNKEYHICIFSFNKFQIKAAKHLMGLITNIKGVLISAKGKILNYKPKMIYETLCCLAESTERVKEDYCQIVKSGNHNYFTDNPVSVKYKFPCRRVAYWPDLYNPLDSEQELTEAAYNEAIRQACDWCPNYDKGVKVIKLEAKKAVNNSNLLDTIINTIKEKYDIKE